MNNIVPVLSDSNYVIQLVNYWSQYLMKNIRSIFESKNITI